MKLPWIEQCLLQSTVGARFGDWLSRLPANPCQYRPGTFRKVTRYDIDFQLDISDLIQWYLYFGFLDPSHEALLAQCSTGDVVIDVGANIGITALRMSKTVGPNGAIHAFEPDRINRNQFQQNLALNKLQNVTIYPFAVGMSNGRGFLYRSEEANSGMSTVRLSGEKETEPVDVVPLDSMFAAGRLSRVDLIKIDVEGAELSVIRGGLQLIQRFRPKLFLEVDDTNLRSTGSSASELLSTIVGFGVQDQPY